MVINLNRSDIEKSIKAYVKDEILGYSRGEDINIKVVQGKSASATVEIIEAEDKSDQLILVDIS